MARRKRTARQPDELEVRTGFWDGIPNTVQHTICLLFLVGLSLAFFGAIHFGGKVLVASDTVNWRASANSVLQYEEESGEYALWATNVFAGMPAFMISYDLAVPQIDVVLKYARRLLWPSSHLIVLFAGMYLLVFYLTRNKLAGVLSAVAFGLTTYIPVLLATGHNSKFIALSLSPWLLLAFAHALRKPGLVASLLFSIALAVNLRAGHFQITYYMLFAVAVWWAWEGAAAAREGRLGEFGRSSAMLVLGGVLAALMVAQPYLAQFEYRAFTVRGTGPGGGAGGMAWDYAMGWSQGVGELLTLIIADAFGGSQAYWGPKAFTAGPHYLTGIVAFLAVVGAVRVKTVAAHALGVAAVLAVLFSLGEHFAVLNRLMFNHFPLFDAFRVPETWLAAAAMLAAVLAGMGVDSVVRAPPPKPLLHSRLGIGFVAMFAAVLLLLLGRDALLDFSRAGEDARYAEQIARSNDVSPDDPRVAQAVDRVMTELRSDRRDRFTGDATRTLLFLAIAGIAFLLFRSRRVDRFLLHGVVILVVLVDLWGVDRRYFNDDRLTGSSGVERAIPEYGFDRFILSQQTDSNRFRVLSLEGSPTQTARPSYYYESLSGYHGAKLRVYQDFLDHILVTPAGVLNTAALKMLNTRYVVGRTPIPGADAVFRDDQTGLNVYELRDALPRAFFVDSTVVAQTAAEAWALLDDPSFHPASVAVVDHDLNLAPETDSIRTASAVISAYSPRRISIHARTDADRLLVLSEVYYPAGWYVTIDGSPADIVRADYLLRGVVVPSGEHEIQFEFHPRGHRLGIWIASLSTAGVYGALLLLLVVGWRRRRRPKGSADETADE